MPPIKINIVPDEPEIDEKEEGFLGSRGYAKWGYGRIKRMLLLELKNGEGGKSKKKKEPKSRFS